MRGFIIDEAAYVSTLPADVFAETVVAADLPWSGDQLRQETLQSLHIARGYLHMESFRELQHYPWSLTQGDVEANVLALRGLPNAPADVTAAQMWHALQAGFSEGRMTRATNLLKETLTTTGLAEKGHGLGASVMRRHHMVCGDTVAARVLGSESRALVARRQEDIDIPCTLR